MRTKVGLPLARVSRIRKVPHEAGEPATTKARSADPAEIPARDSSGRGEGGGMRLATGNAVAMAEGIEMGNLVRYGAAMAATFHSNSRLRRLTDQATRPR